MLADVKKRFNCHDAPTVIPGLIGLGVGETVFGAATWEAFGHKLVEELNRRLEQNNEALEMLTVLIGDFLADLVARDLLPTSALAQLSASAA
jgi:hypothetical protein